MKYLWKLVYEWNSDYERGSVYVYASDIQQAIEVVEKRYSRPNKVDIIKVERLDDDVIIIQEALPDETQ